MPYSYCAGDPVNFVDPDGLTRYNIDQNGYLINIIEDNDNDYICVVDSKGEIIAKSEMYSVNTFTNIAQVGELLNFGTAELNSGISAFEFVSNNTKVEIGCVISVDSDSTQEPNRRFDLFTDGKRNTINFSKIVSRLTNDDRLIYSMVHSHPNNTIPSGFNATNLERSDKKSIGIKSNPFAADARMFVYLPQSGIYLRFDNAIDENFMVYQWNFNDKLFEFTKNRKKAMR